MWPPKQLDTVRFDPLRGSGSCKRAPWRSDVTNRLVWNEPTSIAIVWLIAMGSLALTIARSLSVTNNLAPAVTSIDAVIVATPTVIGTFFWIRAIQRMFSRRTVIIDSALGTCRVQSRTLWSHGDDTHELHEVHLAVVTASSHSQGWPLGLSRTSREYIVLVTPTATFALEEHWNWKVLRSKAEALAHQLRVIHKRAEADNLVNRLFLYFKAPY